MSLDWDMTKVKDIAVVHGHDLRRGLYINGKLIGMFPDTDDEVLDIRHIYPYGEPDGYPKDKRFPKTLEAINEHNKAAIKRRRAKALRDAKKRAAEKFHNDTRAGCL